MPVSLIPTCWGKRLGIGGSGGDIEPGYAYFGWSFFRGQPEIGITIDVLFSFAYIPVSLVALFADKF